MSPRSNPAKRGEDGYCNIIRNIPLFHSINELPIVLDPERIDEGEGIENTLRQNKAKYHQCCGLLISNSRLQWAEKRASTSVPVRAAKTFDDCAKEEILPRVESYPTKYQRNDIVYDAYKLDCLKTEARSKRGKGVRRRVASTSKTPQNWKNFLRDNDNKTELFHFLADKLSAADMTSMVMMTKGEDVCCNGAIALEDLASCTQEEADTRIFVRTRPAVTESRKALMIKANDTDVVVTAISVFPSLKEFGLEKMWIVFGQGKKSRWIPVHEVVNTIGPENTRGLP